MGVIEDMQFSKIAVPLLVTWTSYSSEEVNAAVIQVTLLMIFHHSTVVQEFTTHAVLTTSFYFFAANCDTIHLLQENATLSQAGQEF
jgi:hypothetical protein